MTSLRDAADAALSKLRFERKGPNALVVCTVLTGALLSAGWLVYKAVGRSAQRNRHTRVDKTRDKTLKDTFPASDPPASQYFDIPVNRR